MLGLTNIVKFTPPQPKTYIVKIDQNNPDPLACCTYEGDASSMTKGSSEWDDIFGYKPCIMMNGVVKGYLNPNDFSKYEDGSVAPITDKNHDVMIEFPRMGLDISTSGKVITIKLTDAKDDSNFQYLAYKRGNIQKDYFYLGAYNAAIDSRAGGGSGSSTNISLFSNSGVMPLVNTSITDFINYAHNRGSGYDIMGFYQWTYVQALYVMKYGNLNSQAALGKGYVDGSAAQMTGATDDKGMCYGNPNSDTDRVKLFGLEDAWGNIYQWLGGLYCDSSFNLLTKTSNFTDGTTASDYNYSTPSGLSGNIGGWMKQLQGTNGGGFIGKQTGGSSTTYWSDYNNVAAGYFASVGGDWFVGNNVGLFYYYMFSVASYAYRNLGSRLMYL